MQGKDDAAANSSTPMPPVMQGLGERQILDLLRDGLRENRVEIALQPIVSLPQRKRRFFECYSRIKAADGRVLVPEQYLAIVVDVFPRLGGSMLCHALTPRY